MSELNVLFAKSLSELYAVQKDMENVIHPAKCTWDAELGAHRKVDYFNFVWQLLWDYNGIDFYLGFSAGTDYNGNHYNINNDNIDNN